MNLYKDRIKMTKLFENKYITPSTYSYNAKSAPEQYDGVEKSDQKAE